MPNSLLSSPLAGFRVLDFTRILAGPYCTMLLGDLGAEILKVERPGTGDDTRSWKPPDVNGESCYFLSVNRNKKSVAIDLKHPRGLQLAKALALKSDVLVENFLPGTMERLGLGYDELKRNHPGLIYCSITGYGPDGPYVRRGGYDVIAAAIGGLLHITGPQDGDPCKAGVAVTDLATGLYAHGAIMAALLHRQRQNNAQGQKIDCNLLSTQVATLINIGSNFLNAGSEGRRWGTAHESIVPYQGFRTSDGETLLVGTGNESQFRELCTRLVRLDLLDVDDYRTNAKRVENRTRLIDDLQRTFQTKTLAEWLQIFDGSSMPYGPVNRIKAVFDDPQVKHNRLVRTLNHRSAGEIKVVGPAVTFDGCLNDVRSAPPLLGEHTRPVLKELLSIGDDVMDRLQKENVIGCSK